MVAIAFALFMPVAMLLLLLGMDAFSNLLFPEDKPSDETTAP
nr:hypothetical protein [Streptomyces corallincola]